MKWPAYVRALESRNYRLFFCGQGVSLIGRWMTTTAILWLVYQLSDSPFLLGVVGFANAIPILLLAPIAGVWVDRVNRFRMLVLTQAMSMAQSFALAYFALTGKMDIAHLVVLSLIQGLINAFDIPTRQALVILFVEKRENLGNAIALNSSMFNLARLTGPAIAGFVIAALGAGVSFLIDGFSFLAVLGALFAMRLPKFERLAAKGAPLSELRDGFRYAYGFLPVRALLMMIAFVSLCGSSYNVLMPVFARDVFHGDARLLGFLMSAIGVGALSGAVFLSTRRSVRGLGRIIAAGACLLGGGVLGFSSIRWLPLSLVCLFLAGAGGVWVMASTNTLLQSIVEDGKRGRVMGLFAMAAGLFPVGNLLMGTVADRIGAPMTLTVSGCLVLVVAFIFYRSLPRLRKAAAPYWVRPDVLPRKDTPEEKG